MGTTHCQHGHIKITQMVIWTTVYSTNIMAVRGFEDQSGLVIKSWSPDVCSCFTRFWQSALPICTGDKHLKICSATARDASLFALLQCIVWIAGLPSWSYSLEKKPQSKCHPKVKRVYWHRCKRTDQRAEHKESLTAHLSIVCNQTSKHLPPADSHRTTTCTSQREHLRETPERIQ